MKKNDLLGYLVYFLMIAIAVGVGFGIIRPAFADYKTALGGDVAVVFVILIVLGSVLVSAAVLELGHLLGAKIGKYRVVSWNCLFFQFKEGKDGKKHFGFANFDGLTGETKIVPEDSKKSNPRPFIFIPLAFFLLVIIIGALLMAFGKSLAATNSVWIWAHMIGTILLTVSCMVLLYDIFPAQLDAKNDGYLIPILNNKTNVLAYNEILIAQDKMSRGEKVEGTPVYEEVTDFTAKLNDITIYKRLSEGDYRGALEVIEFTIKRKDKVSRRVYSDAVAQKIAISLYCDPLDKAKEEYIALPLDEKQYISSLSSAPAVRAYILVSGLIDQSINETKDAMDKADSAIKSSGEDKRLIEERLMKLVVQKVIKIHPDWDFSEYSDVFSVDTKKPGEAEIEHGEISSTSEGDETPEKDK